MSVSSGVIYGGVHMTTGPNQAQIGSATGETSNPMANDELDDKMQ